MSEEVRRAIERALSPGRFFVAGGALTCQHQAREQIRWEIFHGHLLDQRQTREEAVFESWRVLLQKPGDTPPQTVVSLRMAEGQGPIFVTRELLVYGEEAYESAPNVIATRRAQLVQRELVGTIDWQTFPKTSELVAEISHYVLLALVGTSRLPITSVESPLPAFSLGQLGYAPVDGLHAASTDDPIQWIERALRPASAAEQARVLELALRAAQPADVPAISAAWHVQASTLGLNSDDTVRAVKALFNQIALTPYTSLIDNLIGFLQELVTLGGIAELQLADLVGFLLRQLARHLNAFDLVAFHNQGANYPDALLVEVLLDVYVSLIERQPNWFLRSENDSADQQRRKRLRRRALRGAWAIYRQYAGHPVPDWPTSPGENARVLAGVSQRVPEEQLLRPAARHRRLFAGVARHAWPDISKQVLLESVDDLDDPCELAELGTALFLDRPLGLFHDPGHADRTPLVSYEAFSRAIAAAQLERIGQSLAIPLARRAHLTALVEQMPIGGMPADRLPRRQAPGVVTLEDAQRVAGDFVIRRTTRQSLDALLTGYDLAPLAEFDAETHRWLTRSLDVLLIRTLDRSAAEHGGEFLIAFDRDLRPRLQLALPRPGKPVYFERTGSERLQAGLRATHVDARACDLPLRARC